MVSNNPVKRSLLSGWTLGLWLFMAVTVAGAMVAAALLVSSFYLRPRVPASHSEIVVRPTPDVLIAVRDLARLESASYHIERVLDLSDKQSRLFGLIQARDALLLVASGDVTAGVDLSRLEPGDVRVEPGTGKVEIALPAATIFHVRLDNTRTYVHSRTTDLLAQRNEALETKARVEAEKSMTEAAHNAGILDRAQSNAARTVESLIKSLGYRDVRVTVRK